MMVCQAGAPRGNVLAVGSIERGRFCFFTSTSPCHDQFTSRRVFPKDGKTLRYAAPLLFLWVSATLPRRVNLFSRLILRIGEGEEQPINRQIQVGWVLLIISRDFCFIVVKFLRIGKLSVKTMLYVQIKTVSRV